MRVKQAKPTLKESKIDSPFIDFIENISPLSVEAKDYIQRKTFVKTLYKKELLIESNSDCPTLYLIKNGIFRSYFNDGAKEITTGFNCEKELINCIISFGLRVPVTENFQALEDSVLLGLDYNDFTYLNNRFPEINTVCEAILHKFCRDADEKVFITRMQGIIGKYQYFYNTRANLLNRVPLKYIASYLNITPETFSRVRKVLSSR